MSPNTSFIHPVLLERDKHRSRPSPSSEIHMVWDRSLDASSCIPPREKEQFFGSVFLMTPSSGTNPTLTASSSSSSSSSSSEESSDFFSRDQGRDVRCNEYSIAHKRIAMADVPRAPGWVHLPPRTRHPRPPSPPSSSVVCVVLCRVLPDV